MAGNIFDDTGERRKRRRKPRRTRQVSTPTPTGMFFGSSIFLPTRSTFSRAPDATVDTTPEEETR